MSQEIKPIGIVICKTPDTFNISPDGVNQAIKDYIFKHSGREIEGDLNFDNGSTYCYASGTLKEQQPKFDANYWTNLAYKKMIDEVIGTKKQCQCCKGKGTITSGTYTKICMLCNGNGIS